MGLNFDGEAAKLAMQQLVETERVFGVLAYCENDPIPVGWCSLDRRKTLPGHDCIEEDIACDKNIWSIHCVTSRVDFKNKGIEEVLCKAALILAKRLNAEVVEAYPEPGSDDGQAYKTWNTFNGYQSQFTRLGFEKILKNFGDREQFYFPMRKKLK